jgi:hypothetical protein
MGESMEVEQVLALCDKLRSMADEAEKAEEMGRWAQLMQDAVKLMEWHEDGQQGACPVDPSQYGLDVATLAVKAGEGIPREPGTLPQYEGALADESEELRKRLKQARMHQDLEQEEELLGQLLEIHPDDADLLQAWTSLKGKKDRQASLERLAKVKTDLRNPKTQRDQAALKAALKQAEILQAEGETDAELLSLIEESHQRHRQIAELVELSFYRTAAKEDQIN